MLRGWDLRTASLRPADAARLAAYSRKVDPLEASRMTPKRWACVVVTVLGCLFTLAASASAECAWVLWDEHGMSYDSYKTAERHLPGAPSSKGGRNEGQDIIGAYPTYAACREGQESKISQMLNRWRTEKAEERPTL